jgi:hypothetical protein
MKLKPEHKFAQRMFDEISANIKNLCFPVKYTTLGITPLDVEVAHWLYTEISDDDKEELYNQAHCLLTDVVKLGCKTGSVSPLIWYTDCVNFYGKHEEEIYELIQNAIALGHLCFPSPYTENIDHAWNERDPFAKGPNNHNLLSKLPLPFPGWEIQDPFAHQQNNMQLLAWWAFEQTAKRLLEIIEFVNTETP